MPENSDIRQSGRNILLIQDIQDGFWLLRHRPFYLSGTETKANWRSWYYIETLEKHLEKWKGKKKKSEINNVCMHVIASPDSSSSSASAVPKAASQATSLPPPQPIQCEGNEDGDLYDDLLLPNE